MPTVLIRGEGIAGSCCLRLLTEAGCDIALERVRRPAVPAVMLSASTQTLLRDVFDRQDLLAGIPQIRKRVVAWGADCTPVTLPHSAVVVSEQELLECIQLGLAQTEHPPRDEPAWTIVASGPPPASCIERQVGSRIASATEATLKPGSDSETCWIESLENGWLFLLPHGSQKAWLLSVGASPESLLEMSRLVENQIAGISAQRRTFPSHPRVTLPLSEPGWVVCGTTALAFDPLCGDGAGNAVREAILASAVVRAAMESASDVNSLVAHYQTRLLSGFKRHLELCIDFYKSGKRGPWWDDQLEDLRRGLVWCSQQLSDTKSFHYRLNGFTLEPAPAVR